MEQVIRGEVEAVDHGQRRIRSLDLSHGDRPIQSHDRAWRQSEQLVVQLQYLPPVRFDRADSVGVDGVDRRLDLVRPGLVAQEALAHDRLALDDQLAVPAAAVLVGEPDEPTRRRGASKPARLDQEHEGNQPHHLRFLRQQLGQQSPQAQGFDAQVLPHETLARARRVALVEDEVDDREHGLQPCGEVGRAGDAIRDPRVPDLALGADQPLGHRRLRHQERVRDLRGRESAQQSERQRHLGVQRERGVAAREDQTEPVVAHGVLHRFL